VCSTGPGCGQLTLGLLWSESIFHTFELYELLIEQGRHLPSHPPDEPDVCHRTEASSAARVFVHDLLNLTVLSTLPSSRGSRETINGERNEGTVYSGTGRCWIPDCSSQSQLWLARDSFDNALYIRERCALHVGVEAASFDFRSDQGSENWVKADELMPVGNGEEGFTRGLPSTSTVTPQHCLAPEPLAESMGPRRPALSYLWQPHAPGAPGAPDTPMEIALPLPQISVPSKLDEISSRPDQITLTHWWRPSTDGLSLVGGIHYRGTGTCPSSGCTNSTRLWGAMRAAQEEETLFGLQESCDEHIWDLDAMLPRYGSSVTRRMKWVALDPPLDEMGSVLGGISEGDDESGEE
jgi:hypothetical protein